MRGHTTAIWLSLIFSSICVNAAVRADVAECLDLPDGL